MKENKEYTEMKKTYLTPAIFEHKLLVESLLTSASPVSKKQIHWGNLKDSEPVRPDQTQTRIDVFEGPDVENI